jgi:hypothetical protein
VNLPQKHKEEINGDAFLEGIFRNNKCQYFAEDDKIRVRKAFTLAIEAHKDDKQRTWDAYIEHIKWTLKDYLDKTTWKDKVTADDLTVTLLHDVIEDHPKFSKRVCDEFWIVVFNRVMNLSKPSASVIAERSGTFAILILEKPSLFSAWWMYAATRFWRKWITILQNTNLYNLIAQKNNPAMIWNQKWLKNYIFYWMIADLDEDDFEIKAADRVNNLWNLTHVDIGNIYRKSESPLTTWFGTTTGVRDGGTGTKEARIRGEIREIVIFSSEALSQIEWWAHCLLSVFLYWSWYIFLSLLHSLYKERGHLFQLLWEFFLQHSRQELSRYREICHGRGDFVRGWRYWFFP